VIDIGESKVSTAEQREIEGLAINAEAVRE